MDQPFNIRLPLDIIVLLSYRQRVIMANLLARQPFKSLATLLFLMSAPPYAIALCFYYAVERNRPQPGWSLKTALGTKMLRYFYFYATGVEFQPDYANPKKLKDRYVL